MNHDSNKHTILQIQSNQARFHFSCRTAFLMSDSSAIRKQLEFYFSDSNLRKDKFLTAKLAESTDGCMILFYFDSFLILLLASDSFS